MKYKKAIEIQLAHKSKEDFINQLAKCVAEPGELINTFCWADTTEGGGYWEDIRINGHTKESKEKLHLVRLEIERQTLPDGFKRWDSEDKPDDVEDVCSAVCWNSGTQKAVRWSSIRWKWEGRDENIILGYEPNLIKTVVEEPINTKFKVGDFVKLNREAIDAFKHRLSNNPWAKIVGIQKFAYESQQYVLDRHLIKDAANTYAEKFLEISHDVSVADWQVGDVVERVKELRDYSGPFIAEIGALRYNNKVLQIKDGATWSSCNFKWVSRPEKVFEKEVALEIPKVGEKYKHEDGEICSVVKSDETIDMQSLTSEKVYKGYDLEDFHDFYTKIEEKVVDNTTKSSKIKQEVTKVEPKSEKVVKNKFKVGQVYYDGDYNENLEVVEVRDEGTVIAKCVETGSRNVFAESGIRGNRVKLTDIKGTKMNIVNKAKSFAATSTKNVAYRWPLKAVKTALYYSVVQPAKVVFKPFLRTTQGVIFASLLAGIGYSSYQIYNNGSEIYDAAKDAIPSIKVEVDWSPESQNLDG